MLTLSTLSWAQTLENLPNDTKALNYLDQTSVDVTQVRNSLVQGVECKEDLSLTTKALTDCQLSLEGTQPQFWQTPGFIIGGISIAFTWGILLGFTGCFGACK